MQVLNRNIDTLCKIHCKPKCSPFYLLMLEIKAIKISRMKATRMLGRLEGSLYFVSFKMQMEKLRKLNVAWQGSQRCSENSSNPRVR